MPRDVDGRTILVTGASRGIGRRVAELLSKRGARLAVTARSATELDTLVREIRSFGGEAEAFPADLTREGDRKELVKRTVLHFGGLDVLINCAGVCSFGEFSTSEDTISRRLLEINFFAPVEMVRDCQPYLAESFVRSKGKWRPAIVNVASICGRWGIPSLSEHCASKHALVGLMEALRVEFTRFDIDVLLVLPGLVKSDDLNRHLLRNDGKIYLDFGNAQPADEVAESVVKSLIRNRLEFAVGFLSSGVWIFRRLFPRGVRFFMQRKVWKFARREAIASR